MGFRTFLILFMSGISDIRIFMRILSPDSSKGFSLIEMLVVISIVLLLSGLTLGALRASRTHQVINQAAAKLVMLVELAKGVAVSERESVYLVIADMGAEPKGSPMRAYTFIKNLQQPEILHHWQFLPKDVVFAGDPTAPDMDLMTEAPIQILENTFIDEADGSLVTGRVRVLVEIRPDGTFYTGTPPAAQSCSLLLDRGSWISDAALNAYFAPDEKAPEDQKRIVFRPLTGVVKSVEAQAQL
jgi:prepilin-type N-terminal cleavage/methylation domain-containing protein